MTKTIFLVGGTGMLGSRIAHHLLDEPDASLRLLVRNNLSVDKRAAQIPLHARGARVVEGDIHDRASPDRATRGVDVIVSAMQGGPDVIIDGRVSLVATSALLTRLKMRPIACGTHRLVTRSLTPLRHATGLTIRGGWRIGPSKTKRRPKAHGERDRGLPGSRDRKA